VILVDTSAWVEFLRDTGSTVCERVDEILGDAIAVCDPVRMEVLAGARDEAHLNALRGLLARASTVPVGPKHYDQAAAMYRACRRNGETVGRLIDCLIAAAAVDARIPILHADADFETLARHTDLRVVA
jgi:predicted nucleic acid-binding protein